MEYRFDLQLFAEDKKEPATPRRRQLAREKGQRFSSQELVSAISLLVALMVLKFSFSHISKLVAKKSVEMWSYIPPPDPSCDWALLIIRDVLVFVGIIVLPIMAATCVSGIGASVFQVGFNIRSRRLVPDFKRLNPVDGIARLFSRRSLVACLKAIVKTVIVGLVAWKALKNVWPEVSLLVIKEISFSVELVRKTLEKILLNCGIFLLFTGFLDYAYQWWEYEKSLMMTPREVKEEIKDTEGKPEIRSAIRARQRQIARRRMMQNVPSADVVIVNPTHYAVALKYDMDTDPAPVIVAKGLDHLALRIRKIAEENGIYVVQDPPLARALYRAGDVGEMIPEELYQAVAEVLAYVYRLSGKSPLEGRHLEQGS